jgi:hypothetical protein
MNHDMLDNNNQLRTLPQNQVFHYPASAYKQFPDPLKYSLSSKPQLIQPYVVTYLALPQLPNFASAVSLLLSKEY